MNSLAKLASLGLVGLLVVACGTAPSAGEAGEDTARAEAAISGVYGAISASPNPIYLSAGEVGTATIAWSWGQSSQENPYACVYVQFNGGTPQLFDCEPPNSLSAPVAPWLEAGNQYVF